MKNKILKCVNPLEAETGVYVPTAQLTITSTENITIVLYPHQTYKFIIDFPKCLLVTGYKLGNVYTDSFMLFRIEKEAFDRYFRVVSKDKWVRRTA